MRDLTRGNPLKQLLLFALPVLMGNLFQQLYSMVDTVIVGRYLGENAMAAVGATGSVHFFIMGFVQGTTSGLAIRTAQAFGRGDDAEIRRSVRCCLILGLGLTIVMTSLSVPFLRPLLRFMLLPDELLNDAALYIQVICGGMFSAIYYNIMSGIMRALGDSRTPLIFLIVSALLNVVLDILFIATFGMGVEGAALATVVAQSTSALCCFIYGRRHCKYLHTASERKNITWKFCMEHLALGVPMGLQFSVTAIGSMTLQSAFNRFGTAGVTAYTVACKVESLAMQPSMALGVTMANYMGQNKGAQRYDRIRQGSRCAMGIGITIAVLTAAFSMGLGEKVMGLFFTGEITEQVRQWAMLYLNFTAFFYPFLASIFVFRNSLQGLGEKAAPMLGGVIELIARVSVASLLPGVLGYLGACMAPSAAWMGAGIWTMVWYFHLERGWRKQGLLKGGRAA